VQELTPFSVLAVAMIFEVGAYFCLVVLVEGVLASQLELVVGKGALAYQTCTD
jgi:hypothetical protein